MMRSILLAATVVLALVAETVAAQPGVDLKGVKVLPKWGAVVKVGKETIDVRITPWTVQDVKGDWLWVGDHRKGWVRRSQVVTLEEAPAYYTQLIDGNQHKAWAYYYRAAAWQEKGDVDKALADSGKELWLNPTEGTYNNRGEIWRTKRDFDKAILDYDQAIRLDPKHPYSYNNRGVAWQAKKNYDNAIADYNEAMRLDPTYGEPLNNAAWLRATCADAAFRDGKKAIELATKACALADWAVADNLDTLAAAYAEAGDFESALKYENKAIESSRRNAAFVASANQRLARYKDHKPYRDE
ncbi:MAG TPA: tetratricopeptide repeat protein [Pirellulales bacterium]|jgi:tetratricopeptide (TPR) repeat protein|nr:tetratricopeptide repeat protein [Pirellulales bacterium]